jgi:hypothetical protein
MKRRTLLKAAAVAAGAATWPRWIRAAFAEDCGPSAGALALSKAYRGAARASRPLLVFVIPEDDDAKWRRGQTLGALINFGDDQALAALAVPSVFCAGLKDLREVVPAATLAEPMAVLVDTDQIPARVTQVPATEPPERGTSVRRSALEIDGRPWAERLKAEDEEVDAQIQSAGAALRDAIAGRADALASLAQRQRDAWGSTQPGIEDALSDPKGALEGLEAVALAEAAAQTPQSAALTARLAVLARHRLKDARVPGSRWGTYHGCGTHIEGEEEQLTIMCGMGHVPAKQARFLYLFAKLPSER